MSTSAKEFTVSVISPDERLWEGQAVSVSSENSAGKFDILPQHANFVTIIKNTPIVVRTATTGNKTLKYKNAVIVVNYNKVAIYAEL